MRCRGPARHPESTDEAQPIRVRIHVQSYGVHQPPDGVVDAQHAVELLDGPPGKLGAQHHTGSALVGLQLVQRGLELPALVVEACQLGGGASFRAGLRTVAVVRFAVLVRFATLTFDFAVDLAMAVFAGCFLAAGYGAASARAL